MFDADVPSSAEVPGPAARGGRRRRCGFRFSWADALIIAAGGLATWLLWGAAGGMAVLPPVVLAHFFLFCNVFRIRRSYELVWAAALVANVLAWQAAGAFSWGGVLLTQAPVTAGFIAAEMRSRRYHGVGCAWINPVGHGEHVKGFGETLADRQVQHERQA